MTDPRNVIDFPDIQNAEAEAADWIMKFEEGEKSATDIVEFQAWLAKGEHYREAYQRLAALWGALDQLEEFEDISHSAERTSKNTGSNSPFLMSRRAGVLGMAASVAFAVVAGTYWFSKEQTDPNYYVSYATQIGERQTIELPDGSNIELNTDTKVDIEFTKQDRLVHLVKGEAFFEVESNPEKPFTVLANGGAVKAVGTAFTVRLKEEKINVTVTEGRVALFGAEDNLSGIHLNSYKPKMDENSILQVTAGQQVVFRKNIEKLEHIQPAVLKRKLSWREGVLAFSGDPLKEMVDEVSRYTDIQIDIEGDDLQSFPVAGYFEAGEVESMLEALTLMADIDVQYIHSKHIVLKAKEPR